MRALFGSIFAAFLACTLLAGPALAEREFPGDAVRARFKVIQFPVVTLDGRMLRLAPGAQVRDLSNQIIMPTSLDANLTFHVLYTMDNNGEVFRVWLLSEDELAAIKAQGR